MKYHQLLMHIVEDWNLHIFEFDLTLIFMYLSKLIVKLITAAARSPNLKDSVELALLNLSPIFVYQVELYI